MKWLYYYLRCLFECLRRLNVRKVSIVMLSSSAFGFRFSSNNFDFCWDQCFNTIWIGLKSVSGFTKPQNVMIYFYKVGDLVHCKTSIRIENELFVFVFRTNSTFRTPMLTRRISSECNEAFLFFLLFF